MGRSKRTGGHKKRRAPTNTYWRGAVLWGRIEVKGIEQRWSLRTSDARVAKARIRAELDRQIAATHFGDDRKTYMFAFAQWSAHIATQVSPQTAKRYASSLKQLEPALLPLYIDEIDKSKVSEIVKFRRDAGVTVATIRRDLSALSSVLKYAEDHDWRDGNPALAWLGKLNERRDPIVLPEHEHIERVVQRAPSMFAAIIRTARATGCRQNELVTAERRNLDHVRRQLLIRGKGNKVRPVDLDDATYEMLRSLPASLGSPWLFWHGDGQQYSSPSSNYRRLMRLEAAAAQKAAQKRSQKDSGFRASTFHHLRHRFAVDWLKSGRSIYDLQKRLGHTSIKTTEIYLAYLTPDEERTVKQQVTK